MKNEPHLALARKYRPQQFDDVAGQEAVSTTLKNAVESGKVGHAYLFFGPRGVGKTTSARILAKALNCEKGPTSKPCGKCPSCVEIAAGTSIDVLELDAASNTQVDKVREMIIETVSLAPSRDRRKVFVIDEVHMLSTSSFNALLKTLEEPPEHVVFILATTELAKIPATIVSRCQRFRFRPMPREVTVEHLKKIAKLEKVKADKEALAMIARASGGALRDAVGLFDQARAFSGGDLTAESVAELMGTLPSEYLMRITAAVLARDGAALSECLKLVTAEGFEPTQLLRDLRERLQELYLASLGVGGEVEGDWAGLVEKGSSEAFSFMIQRVNRTLAEMRGADSPQIAFELGIYGLLEPAHDLRAWVERLEALEKRLSEGSALPIAPAPAVPAHAVATEASVREAVSPPARSAGSAPGEKAGVANVWPAVLHSLRDKKPALASSLDAARLLPAEGGPWTLVFDQNFAMERAKAHQAAIEAELKRVTGKPVRLEFAVESGKGGAKKRARPPGGDEGWVDSSEDDGSIEDAGVKKTLGAFGGTVRSVKKK